MTSAPDQPWGEWEHDRLNPDNYFRIPEFGVKPADVNFRGFSGPIITTRLEQVETFLEIRRMVGFARSFLQQVFASYRDAQDAHIAFLDATSDPSYRPTTLDVAAWCYFDFIWTLERKFEGDKDEAGQLLAMASAGATLGGLGQVVTSIRDSRHLDVVEASLKTEEILSKFAKKGGSA
ncbi:hypothetical protein PSQ39_06390 [Curvibacter sp. HBC28]|uniref:Uncharacterized protein n=1 Tax=Curvibacter microcysteis TaxID=3026419 RepID=A0ABT5MCF4_9BURK|nr:hypothetical protein [Curvibacter sp. HBC28]MDD0814254.1 hypothetical protein [Curvibacter sp. HBC28]